MKKFITTILFYFIAVLPSLAAVLPNNNSKVNAEKLQAFENGVRDFSKMSFFQYEQMIGHKANKLEKYAYSRMQKKSQKMLDQNGNLLEKYKNKYQKYFIEDAGTFLGGFALGFFLGAIGLLIAFLVNQNSDTDDLMKGAWWGFGTIVIILLSVILISAISVQAAGI
jgi:hypothetical protein